MVKSASQVLKDSNYYISYDYTGGNRAKVAVSWRKTSYEIWYSKDATLENTFTNDVIKCPLYMTPALVDLWIKDVCGHYKYPYEFVNFNRKGSRVNVLYFGEIDDADGPKAEMLYDIYRDFYEFGLRPQHIQLANEAGVFEALQILSGKYLGITIENR